MPLLVREKAKEKSKRRRGDWRMRRQLDVGDGRRVYAGIFEALLVWLWRRRRGGEGVERGDVELTGMRVNAAGGEDVCGDARRGALQCDGEAVRLPFCGYLAMFSVSNARLGAEDVRARG